MPEVDFFAVQPRITLADYESVGTFSRKHRRLAEQVAEMRSSKAVPALVVWPEMVGAFLGLVGVAELARGCGSTEAAMRKIALRMLPQLVATALRHRVVATRRLVLTALAPKVWDAYRSTFSDIARDFDLWVVAGSALLPRNALGDDSASFRPSDARVFNTSLTFAPSGRVVAATRKVNLVPTQEDLLGLSAGAAEDLSVVETPFGSLGTLICYDGFVEPHTSHEPSFTPCGPMLDRLGAVVVAQPSANAWAWEEPWEFNEPGETLLRSEQWFAEGFAAQLGSLASVRWCVNPQLVGSVLDNTFEAPSLILERSGDDVRVIARAADPRCEEIVHARVQT
ncbi:MAG: nitrilase-related carbon-nitrogen hydrolase [Acidimicrobiales bacterium]